MGDLPDYTREMVLKGAAGFTGLEELAARLGSIVPWDVKGNIVLMEDFESEETEWVNNSDALGSTATRSSRHKYSGDWSLKLDCVANDNAYAEWFRHWGKPLKSKYGLFCRAFLVSYVYDLVLEVKINTPTEEFMAQVDLDLWNGDIFVKTTGGTWHTVTSSLNLWINSEGKWHSILLTSDLNTGYYSKIVIGDVEYDISDVPLYQPITGKSGHGTVFIDLWGNHGHASTAYVDDIILVKNIPS
jgi:hypothetical protein